MSDPTTSTGLHPIPRFVGGAVPLDCHGVSVTGRNRSINQDDYLLAPLDVPPDAGPALLLAVADGIGGGPAGERASALAIQTLHEFVRKTVGEPEVLKAIDPGDLLVRAARRCHEEILADIEVHPKLFGMGTTLTAALVLWPHAWIVNAGDSRCYLLRDGQLTRLTRDQTMVEKLLESGVLTPETAKGSRWRHALWNHLGKRSDGVEPESGLTELRPGDALLLATDGVTDVIPDAELEPMANAADSARNLVRRMVWAADEKGGKDDRTVVLVRFSP
jgi:protein phosphatase